jgi:hypothetical protein
MCSDHLQQLQNWSWSVCMGMLMDATFDTVHFIEVSSNIA